MADDRTPWRQLLSGQRRVSDLPEDQIDPDLGKIQTLADFYKDPMGLPQINSINETRGMNLQQFLASPYSGWQTLADGTYKKITPTQYGTPWDDPNSAGSESFGHAFTNKILPLGLGVLSGGAALGGLAGLGIPGLVGSAPFSGAGAVLGEVPGALGAYGAGTGAATGAAAAGASPLVTGGQALQAGGSSLYNMANPSLYGAALPGAETAAGIGGSGAIDFAGSQVANPMFGSSTMPAASSLFQTAPSIDSMIAQYASNAAGGSGLETGMNLFGQPLTQQLAGGVNGIFDGPLGKFMLNGAGGLTSMASNMLGGADVPSGQTYGTGGNAVGGSDPSWWQKLLGTAASGAASGAGGAGGAGAAGSFIDKLLAALPGLAATGLGAYGANQKENATADLYNRFADMGEPYRASLATLSQNPGSYYQSPMVKDALQQGSDTLARSLSAKVGNPILNPTALQEMQNYTTRGLLDAYNKQFSNLTAASQIGIPQAAILGTNAANAAGGVPNAIGSGIQSLFGGNSFENQLLEMFKQQLLNR